VNDFKPDPAAGNRHRREGRVRKAGRRRRPDSTGGDRPAGSSAPTARWGCGRGGYSRTTRPPARPPKADIRRSSSARQAPGLIPENADAILAAAKSAEAGAITPATAACQRTPASPGRWRGGPRFGRARPRSSWEAFGSKHTDGTSPAAAGVPMKRRKACSKRPETARRAVRMIGLTGMVEGDRRRRRKGMHRPAPTSGGSRGVRPSAHLARRTRCWRRCPRADWCAGPPVEVQVFGDGTGRRRRCRDRTARCSAANRRSAKEAPRTGRCRRRSDAGCRIGRAWPSVARKGSAGKVESVYDPVRAGRVVP